MDFFGICSPAEDAGNAMNGTISGHDVSSGQSEEENGLSDLQSLINGYVIPAVGILGVILNLCGVSTIVHLGVNTSSMVYMLALAVGDLISGFFDSIIVVG